MTKLSWGAPGERFYESGVDQGVLYVDGSGHVWNGLVSVTEKNSGGDVSEYYLDGIKYAENKGVENFEADVAAFSSPPEFALCDGTYEPYSGLVATNQPRKRFGFSYRTKIGNDLEGLDHGYKIHLVYDALASPSDRSNETLGDSEPEPLEWSITAIPVEVSGMRPTAHFIVDSKKTDEFVLGKIESALYGTDITSPYLPSITELIEMYVYTAEYTVIDYGDGTWSVVGPDVGLVYVTEDTVDITSTTVEFLDADTFTISSWNLILET
jgi:hypothetical protein